MLNGQVDEKVKRFEGGFAARIRKIEYIQDATVSDF